MWAKHTSANKRNSSKSAFTIVELLIVIVVIAILAAITIVAFNGIQDRARASAAAQSSSQAAKKVKVWQVDNEAITPTCSKFYELVTGTTSGAPTDPTPPATGPCAFTYKDTSYQYASYTAGSYCATATVGNKSYKVTESTGQAGVGCAGHGVGGTAAITNLVLNPSFENGTTSNWVANATYASFGIVTGSAPQGTKYLRLSRSAIGDAYASHTVSVVPPANSPYTISFWIWADTPTTLDNTLLFRTANSGSCCINIATVASQPVTTTPTRVVMSGNTSSNPTSGLQMILRVSSTIGQNIYYDGFMITAGSDTYVYSDGDTPGWAWNGTASSASSTGPPQ